MGYLKGHFQSLRGLRQQIKNPRDHKIALAWIRVCLILHNKILDIEQVIDEDDIFYRDMLQEGLVDDLLPADEREDDTDNHAEVEDIEGAPLEADEGPNATPGQRKRAKLRRRLLQDLTEQGLYSSSSGR
jgi:hypothetical protein